MSSLKEQDGKYYQQCKVIILATNQKAEIGILTKHNTRNNLTKIDTDGKVEACNRSVDLGIRKVYHLYILSDEEIQESDWFLCTYTNIISNTLSGFEKKECCKKIIATTDITLKIDNDITSQTSASYDNSSVKQVIVGTKSLPQPSDSFIQKYIEEYNKGSVIENVLVEYETYIHNPQTNEEWHSTNQLWAEDCELQKRLKTDLDNTITIKKVKDSYSREEVLNIIRQYGSYIACKYNHTHPILAPLDEWADKNL